MRKYFTWRCIGLHVLVLIVVPTFFLLGRWQFDAARSGNTLSWAYTVEWPLFGIYAIYVWWRLIHEKSTALARLWAARDRTAAANSGMPLEEVPGWALDKKLSAAVIQASLGSPGSPVLPPGTPAEALESQETKAAAAAPAGATMAGGHPQGRGSDTEPVVDARVVGVKVVVDDDLEAYNRYLADLNRNDPPKRW
ncbi:MAG TPA: hypothetical protein VHZ02_14465 [Acidimicrobiales bacterium]|jgi:hypothetical protein|nr:hypothetical protein [Acidimicrobiales bacterium]